MRRLSDIDLRLLRIFSTIVDCNGFQNAQLALSMAQSTLSTHMANLEEKLGSRLCERGRRGFKLTIAGEETYRAIQDLLGGIEKFDANMRRIHGRESERLRLGVIDTVTTHEELALPQALQAFCSAQPNVFVDVEIQPPEQLQRALMQGRRDVIIGASLHRMPTLTYIELAPEEHHLYCGSVHPWFAIPDSAISRDDFLKARFSVRSYQFFDDTYLLGKIVASASVSSMEAQELLILSGKFIGFLPCHKGEHWVERGKMRAIKPKAWTIQSRFCAAYDANSSALPLKRNFVSHLTASRPLQRRMPPRAASPLHIEAQT